MREMKIVAKSGNKLCLRWRPPADWNPLFSGLRLIGRN